MFHINIKCDMSVLITVKFVATGKLANMLRIQWHKKNNNTAEWKTYNASVSVNSVARDLRLFAHFYFIISRSVSAHFFVLSWQLNGIVAFIYVILRPTEPTESNPINFDFIIFLVEKPLHVFMGPLQIK